MLCVHTPPQIVQVREVPYTLNGKKVEVPVRKVCTPELFILDLQATGGWAVLQGFGGERATGRLLTSLCRLLMVALYRLLTSARCGTRSAWKNMPRLVRG